MEEIFKNQILNLNENLIVVAKANKKLVERVNKLEREQPEAAFQFIANSLAYWTSIQLAADFPGFRDDIVVLCENIEIPDHIDKDIVAAEVKKFTDYLRDPDKKQMPGWFKGVVQGGVNVESPNDDLQE